MNKIIFFSGITLSIFVFSLEDRRIMESSAKKPMQKALPKETLEKICDYFDRWGQEQIIINEYIETAINKSGKCKLK